MADSPAERPGTHEVDCNDVTPHAATPITPRGRAATVPAPAHTAPSVRLALPAEAREIAAIQRRAWLSSPDLRGIAEAVDLEQATELWWQAITRPPMAHYRVLVAVQPRDAHVVDDPAVTASSAGLSRQVVCGFAAVGPSDDPDAASDDLLVAEFCVEAAARGLGHDDRLMNAVADTARADGYRRLTWWVASTDDELRAWLGESGWAPDGAHREVGTEDTGGGTVPVRLKQVRLHTDISVPD